MAGSNSDAPSRGAPQGRDQSGEKQGRWGPASAGAGAGSGATFLAAALLRTTGLGAVAGWDAEAATSGGSTRLGSATATSLATEALAETLLVRLGLREAFGALVGADTLETVEVVGSANFDIFNPDKMGAGTNVQERLLALHHLDVPWKPSDVEQREGRILRQGNECEEVEVFRYVTEGSFDSYMWVRRESRLFDCVAWVRALDRTCASVRSSLSTRARPAMTGCEAVETL